MSRHYHLRLCRVVSALLFLLWGSACVAQQQQYGSIIGELHVSRGDFPQHRVLVQLQLHGATIDSTYADGQGRFGFYSLGGNSYRIVIDDEDFERVDQSAILNPSIMLTTMVQINLQPRSAPPKPNLSRKDVPGKNPYMVDLEAYTRRFPKKAIKEYKKGVEAEKKKDYKDAMKAFQKTIQLAPDFYPAHNDLGSSYVAQGDLEGAQREFLQALRLDQNAQEAYFNLAYVYLLREKYGEAESVVHEGLRRDPNSAFGQFVLGASLHRIGKLTEAEITLKRAVQLDATMAKAYLELANIYLVQQKTEQAVEELRSFLKSVPDDPMAPKVKEVLARLEKAQQSATR